MDWQSAFNIAFSIAGILGGIMLKSVLDTLKDLRIEDRALGSEIKALAVTIPQGYMSKSDYHEISDAMFRKLDRIEEKLDKKVDK